MNFVVVLATLFAGASATVWRINGGSGDACFMIDVTSVTLKRGSATYKAYGQDGSSGSCSKNSNQSATFSFDDVGSISKITIECSTEITKNVGCQFIVVVGTSNDTIMYTSKVMNMGSTSSSYQCSDLSIPMTPDSAVFHFDKIQLQAFGITKNKFSPAVNCSSPKTTTTAKLTKRTTHLTTSTTAKATKTTTHLTTSTTAKPTKTTTHLTTSTTAKPTKTTTHLTTSTTAKPTKTTTHLTTSTTAKPTKTTTHLTTSTTAKPTKTTTHLTTSTTAKPTKTTTHLTTSTTAKPTKTTTHMSTSTTSHKPTKTTSHMVTTPRTPEDKYVVKDGNYTCLSLQADITIALDWVHKNMSGTKNITVPPRENVTVTGSCSNVSDSMNIKWKSMKDSVTIDMVFTMESENYTLSTFNINYTLTMDNITVPVESMNSGLTKFSTHSGYYYKCDEATTLKLNRTTVTFTNMKLQGFNSGHSSMAEKENNCKNPAAKKTSAVVPIIVGAVLAGMVVVVLIGYCIGRRRAARNNYETMP